MADNPKPETVAEIRDAAFALWGDEHERASSLNSRASGLTGFVGIILSLAAALGASSGTEAASRLSDWARIAVGVAVTLALALLILAVVFAVWKVLLPRPTETISATDIDAFPTARFTELTPMEFNGYLIKAYSHSLKLDREGNKTKAKWLRRAYKLVCFGLVLVTLAGASATVDAYVGRDPGPEPSSKLDGRDADASR